MKTITRYVITHIGKDGLRTLIGPAQGRNTYATMQDAEAERAAIIQNNSIDTLNSVYGLPLSVRECECYPVHFDPVGRYFED